MQKTTSKFRRNFVETSLVLGGQNSIIVRKNGQFRLFACPKICLFFTLFSIIFCGEKIRRPLAKGGARLEASLAGASDPSFFAWLNPAAGGTFSGLCFASLWHESCCCLRLSRFSKARRRARDLFFMDSKGDVRQFFWLVFRKPLARILLLFEAFASGFPRPDGGLETCCFLWIPKVTFGSFSGLCFASLWHESCCCLRLSQAVFQGQTEG